MKRPHKILFALIAINVGLFLLASLYTANDFQLNLLYLGAQVPILVLNGEVWRLLTAAFLHGSVIHILFNMYAFWILGRIVSAYYGGKKLLLVYIVTAIAGNLLSYVVATQLARSELFTISVGASGAIFGLLGLILGNLLYKSNSSRRLPLRREQLLLVVGYNLLLGFLLPGIDWLAHIGGLIAGLLLAFFVKPNN